MPNAVNVQYFHGTPSDPHNVAGYTIPVTLTVNPNFAGVGGSPQVILSPLYQNSPSLMIMNLPNTNYRNSPSPIVPTRMLVNLEVNPLVATPADGELWSSPGRVQYDVSKDPHTARISRFGISHHLVHEERDALVIEGAPYNTTFHITFDHPVSMFAPIRCNGALTVGDLIKLLHSHLHERATATEMSDLQSEMELYTKAIKNRCKRCRASFDQQAEWADGLKRVDILGKESRLRGVSLVSTSVQDRWDILVSFGK